MRPPLVLYDEACDACTALAAWIERRGVRVAPIGSDTGGLWLRDLAPAARYAAVHAVDADGRRHTGGAAVPVVLSALPGLRPLALVARRFPRVTDTAYRGLARRRGAAARLLGPRRASRGRTG